MSEQKLKRFQDALKLLSVCLEQLQEVGWILHDIVEDLEVELSPGHQVAASKALDVPKGDVVPG